MTTGWVNIVLFTSWWPVHSLKCPGLTSTHDERLDFSILLTDITLHQSCAIWDNDRKFRFRRYDIDLHPRLSDQLEVIWTCTHPQMTEANLSRYNPNDTEIDTKLDQINHTSVQRLLHAISLFRDVIGIWWKTRKSEFLCSIKHAQRENTQHEKLGNRRICWKITSLFIGEWILLVKNNSNMKSEF